MGLKGMAAQVHLRPFIQLKKPAQTAAVIIMPMGQHRHIHQGQIHPQLFGIVGKSAALSHVKEDPAAQGFYVQAQAMLRSKALQGSIFHQYPNFHGSSSLPKSI